MSHPTSPYKFPPTRVSVILNVSDYERLHQKISGVLHYKFQIYEHSNYEDLTIVSISTPIETNTITIYLDATSHFYKINYSDLNDTISKSTIDLHSTVNLSVESYVVINNTKHITGTQRQNFNIEYYGPHNLKLPLDESNNSPLLPIFQSVNSIRKNGDHYDVNLTYSGSASDNPYISNKQYMIHLYDSANTLVAETNTWTSSSQSVNNIVNVEVPLVIDSTVAFVIVDTLYFFLPHIATTLDTDRITLTDIKDFSS